MADQELSRQLANIRATRQQQAFESALQQFERDRAARESAERLGLMAGESLGAQGAQLAQLGQLAREGDVQAATLLEQIGKDQMAREQAGLDIAYEDFVRQGITAANSCSSCHPYLEVSQYNHLRKRLSSVLIILYSNSLERAFPR